MQYQTHGNQAMLSAMRKPNISTQLFRSYLDRAKPYIEHRVRRRAAPAFQRARIYRQIIDKYVLSR